MTQGKPTAAPAFFPYKHANMHHVMVQEGLIWRCGHERTPENTRAKYVCRECDNAYQRARYASERRSLARMVGEARA